MARGHVRLSFLYPMRSMYDVMNEHPDEDSAEQYFVNKRWPNGIRCPKCDHDKVYDAHMRRSSRRRKKMWKCHKCAHKFTVTSGTVMEGTKLPLRKWLAAYHEIGGAKKSMSSRELSRKLGIGLRPAWHLGHRIRASMTENDQKFSGIVESDEAYLGGKRKHHGRGYRGNKVAVQTIIKRGKKTTRGATLGTQRGRGGLFSQAQTIVLNKDSQVDGRSVGAKLRTHTVPGKTVLMTDDSPIYTKPGETFAEHHTVKHKVKEYARVADDGHFAHTNTAEGYFGNFKRQIEGTHHSVSKKHAQRYAEEHDHKYNHRDQGDVAVTEAAIGKMAGKRVKLFKSKDGGDSLLSYAHDETPEHDNMRGMNSDKRKRKR